MATVDPTYENARREKERHTEKLMSLSNVVGVGVGRKTRGGQRLPSWSILVYVKKKLPAPRLDPKDLIPADLAGVPTDVIETGEPVSYHPNSK